MGAVADSDGIVAIAHGMTPTMNDSEVLVHVIWLDNDNTPRDRVQVEVAYKHHPLIPGICPWGVLELSSSTTMQIVN
jgi:hypothetical protein